MVSREQQCEIEVSLLFSFALSDLEGLYTNEVASMVRVNGHHEGSMPLGKSQLLLQKKTRVRSKLGALVCTVIHFDLISVQ